MEDKRFSIFRAMFDMMTCYASMNIMKTIILVFGARPEAIKMCPLVKVFHMYSSEFTLRVCVREIFDQDLGVFDVVPDFALNIMQKGQNLYDITSRAIHGVRDVLKQKQSDIVLVHGDTATSTAEALAAFYQQIPVAHVEAGLRTRNIYSPCPEVINRQLTGCIATYHFTPTSLARQNILKEKAHGHVFVTGNTVTDTLHLVSDKLRQDAALVEVQRQVHIRTGYDVTRLEQRRRLVLITVYRREHFRCERVSYARRKIRMSEYY